MSKVTIPTETILPALLRGAAEHNNNDMNSFRISFHRHLRIALHYSLRVLIVLTPLLVAWNQFGMNRSFVLDGESGHQYVEADDRAQGGDSIGSVARDGKSTVMDCRIGAKFTWPFCSLAIRFAALPDGVDFSDYESITFDIGYTGPGPELVRFFMRNYEPGLSNTADPQSLKVNGIEFAVPHSGEVTVPMKSIQVASWWVANRKIPLQHTDMRVDRVPYVELQTATDARPGDHRLTVRSIRFNGKWISEARLLRWLTRAWLLYGILHLIAELLDFRDRLLATKGAVSRLADALRLKRTRERETQHVRTLTAPAVDAADIAPSPVTAAQMEDARDPEPVAEEAPTSPAETRPATDDAAQPEASSGYLKRISTMVGNSMRIIPVDDILYFQSDQKYTKVVTADAEVLIRKTLKDLLAELDPEQFWRIHRSIVVNALEVVSIEPDRGGEMAVRLKNRDERLPVSDTFVKKIRQMCV